VPIGYTDSAGNALTASVTFADGPPQ
jgi:hypothetical protein